MTSKTKQAAQTIRDYALSAIHGMLRESGGALPYPFLTPGSDQYPDVLWDWDSWATNVALRELTRSTGDETLARTLVDYEYGCVKNYLAYGGMNGWIPIRIDRQSPNREQQMLERNNGRIYSMNMHKPCLAQHAAFLSSQDATNVSWLLENERFYYLQTFVNAYHDHYRHHPTGLCFWANDKGGGPDNDPTAYYRPDRSCGSIFLNSFLAKEYNAIIWICTNLGYNEIASAYTRDRTKLVAAIQDHCWDERDGFFYSVDLNLLPYREPQHPRDQHPGGPRRYDSLIMRIGTWSGFLPMWAGIATQQQAERIVKEHFRDQRTFRSPYGVRTLSRLEKMYDVRAGGNPSSWLGPIWGISNYLVFRGLVKYGFYDDAQELAESTITMFGDDIAKTGAMHEYYEPESGRPILNHGFLNWNLLVLNMIGWLSGEAAIEEF